MFLRTRVFPLRPTRTPALLRGTRLNSSHNRPPPPNDLEPSSSSSSTPTPTSSTQPPNLNLPTPEELGLPTPPAGGPTFSREKLSEEEVGRTGGNLARVIRDSIRVGWQRRRGRLLCKESRSFYELTCYFSSHMAFLINQPGSALLPLIHMFPTLIDGRPGRNRRQARSRWLIICGCVWAIRRRVIIPRIMVGCQHRHRQNHHPNHPSPPPLQS